MGKELYFECECGGKAVHRIFDLFVCEECGKTYFCGNWDEFCWSRDEF